MTLTLPTADVTTKEPQAQLRGAAIWLISAFAVVGASLVASLSLGALKDVTDRTSLWLACICFGVAIVGIMVAIGFAAAMLLPSTYTVEDAQEASNQGTVPANPLVFGVDRNLGTLLSRLTTTSDNWATMSEAQRQQEKPVYDQRVKLLQKWMDKQAVARLRERYRDSRRGILFGAILTTAGALGYALYTTADLARAQTAREEALTAREKALTQQAKQLAQDEAAVRSAKAIWTALPKDSGKTAVEQRAAAIQKREVEIQADQAALNAAALTALDFRATPAQATWQPTKDIPGCGKAPVKVAVQRLTFTASTDKNRVGLMPTARIVTLDTACPGQILDVTAENGTLTMVAQAWSMKGLTP